MVLVYGDDEITTSRPMLAIKNALNVEPSQVNDGAAYPLVLRSNHVVRRDTGTGKGVFQTTQRYIEYGKTVKALVNVAHGKVTMQSMATLLRAAPSLASQL
eukprot:2107837-Rhodomonas_salina.1